MYKASELISMIRTATDIAELWGTYPADKVSVSLSIVADAVIVALFPRSAFDLIAVVRVSSAPFEISAKYCGVDGFSEWKTVEEIREAFIANPVIKLT